MQLIILFDKNFQSHLANNNEKALWSELFIKTLLDEQDSIKLSVDNDDKIGALLVKAIFKHPTRSSRYLLEVQPQLYNKEYDSFINIDKKQSLVIHIGKLNINEISKRTTSEINAYKTTNRYDINKLTDSHLYLALSKNIKIIGTSPIVSNELTVLRQCRYLQDAKRDLHLKSSLFKPIPFSANNLIELENSLAKPSTVFRI